MGICLSRKCSRLCKATSLHLIIWFSITTRTSPHNSLHLSRSRISHPCKVVVSLTSIIMRMVLVLHVFTLRIQVLKEILLLSLTVTYIECVPCVLFMIKDVHGWCRELVIVRTLVMNICISTSTSIEAILMGDLWVFDNSICVCIHNFLTRT